MQRIDSTTMRFMKMFSLFLIGMFFLVGCKSTKKIVYLQDIVDNSKEIISNYSDVKIRPNDKLFITVSSKEEDAASPYNLKTGATYWAQGAPYPLYVVDSEGYISFPVLGKLQVAGLTRSEVENKIADLLREGDHLKDAVVIVQLRNFQIFVLGEVVRPNRYGIDNDRVSVLDAIAMAGDLTIYGRRDSVLVIRETTEGEREYHYFNLLDSDFVKSSAFYLQQNDMVYVKPNKRRAQQTNINQNNTAGVWLSLASILISSLGILVNLNK